MAAPLGGEKPEGSGGEEQATLSTTSRGRRSRGRRSRGRRSRGRKCLSHARDWPVNVDELHGLDPTCQDFILSALEDRVVRLSISQGAYTHDMMVHLDPFTLIGATTNRADLSDPFLSRFKTKRELEPYSVDAVAEILARAAGRAGDGIAPAALLDLAARSRGNAREAIGLLDAARILAQASGASVISQDIAVRSAEHLGIDEHGLREEERRLIVFLVSERRAVGLRTLADSLGLDQKTVRDVYEPYLVRTGWIRRTPWGRKATDKAIEWAIESGLVSEPSTAQAALVREG